jgi:2-polyprenyl-3-methyl-5-hydroxy-6-metoxy-1,4-benzoquinol methylase
MTMPYTEADYQHDLRSEDCLHIRSRERFRAFYDRLGHDREQCGQAVREARFSFVRPQGDIIELGCHIGFNLIRLAEAGHRVTGIDISAPLIAEARRRVAALQPEVAARITLIYGFIEDMPESQQYDTVLLLETLEHVIDPEAVVRKAAALTAPGGRVFVSAPTTRAGSYSHVRSIGPGELREWLEAAGLEVEMARHKKGEFGETYGVARKP